MAAKMKKLTMGKSNHQAWRGDRPMSLHHSAKLIPGIQAFDASMDTFLNRILRLKHNKT
jgi:hypothetical protein